MHSPQPISHLYEYQGLRPMCNVRPQVQKATNDVSFLQIRSLLLIQQQGVFLSIKNVQCLDELYRARIILQFVLNNLGVTVVVLFQDRIRFRCVPMVHHLAHLLLSPIRFLDDHATLPISDVMGLYLDFLKNRSNHGIFYPLLSFHQMPLNFSMLQFWQKLI